MKRETDTRNTLPKDLGRHYITIGEPWNHPRRSNFSEAPFDTNFIIECQIASLPQLLRDNDNDVTSLVVLKAQTDRSHATSL